MAKDGVLPSVFARINSRTQVQEYGVTFFFVVMLVVLLFLSSFQRILGFVMFFDSISIISAAFAIYILRRKGSEGNESNSGFRIWGYPWLPAIFILVYIGVSFSVMLADPDVYLVGFALFMLGYPLYHLLRKSVRKTTFNDHA